jgi:hypothetical protein
MAYKVAVYENRQPVTAVKFINKSSLFIVFLSIIRLPKLKVGSEQETGKTFVALP